MAPDGRIAGMAWVLTSLILTGSRLPPAPSRRCGSPADRHRAVPLAAAETAARAVANHLALLVTADNAGARRFYARHGYRHVGGLAELARPGLDEALYWKTLRPHGTRLPT